MSPGADRVAQQVDETPRVLVQTRLVDSDKRWLAEAANREGLSVAGMLRRLVAEARDSDRVVLDAAALESRLADRIRTLEERVGRLEART